MPGTYLLRQRGVTVNIDSSTGLSVALGQCSESSLLFGKSERVFCLYNELKFHFMTTYSLMTAARDPGPGTQGAAVLQCCSAAVRVYEV